MDWPTHLFGRDRTTSLRFIMLAICLFVVLLVLLGLSDSIFIWIFTGYRFLYFLVVFLGLAALNAYLNDGLIISCLLAYIPTVGLLFYNVVLFTDFGLNPLLVVSLYAAAGGLLYGLPSGIVGYLFGTGIRHFATDTTV